MKWVMYCAICTCVGAFTAGIGGVILFFALLWYEYSIGEANEQPMEK